MYGKDSIMLIHNHRVGGEIIFTYKDIIIKITVTKANGREFELGFIALWDVDITREELLQHPESDI